MKLLTHTVPAAVMSAMIMTSSLAYAHDTEIYFSRATADNDENQPVANVFVMLDTSGSMRWCEEPLERIHNPSYNARWCTDYATRRINILQNAMGQLLDSVSPSIRMGIGQFNFNTATSEGAIGGRVLVPVTELTPDAKRLIRAELAKLNGAGNTNGSGVPADSQPVGDTPTARAFSEAARYMMGMAPVFGTAANGAQDNVCLVTENVCVDKVVWSGWSNVSSCTASSTVQCQTVRVCSWFTCYNQLQRRTSSVVKECTDQCTSQLPIVTGGKYVSPMNMKNQCESNHIILFTDGSPSSDDRPRVSDVASGNCVLNSTGSYTCQENIARYLNSDSNAKKREVFTHNIGLYMGDNKSNMESVSDAGGGSTSNADNAEQLLAAFLKSFELIDEQSRSISAPGVAVNAMNRFQHLDQLYYAVFQPAKSSYWNGNLKRYQLVGGEIHGQGGLATDPATGFFSPQSRSIWSTAVDGMDVTKGGAREHIGTRNLFYNTSVGGALSKFNWNSTTTPSNTQLGLPSNATPEQRLAVLNGLQTLWGDPLHSAPIMVNYGVSEDNNYVFVSTNGGMLHAIDTRNGSEVFSFMPSEFLSRSQEFTTKRLPLNADNTRQTYGLDASWVAWRRSGATSMSAPEHVYLYGGMRRGGRSYFALDVSTVSTPRMLWQIDNSTTGYAGLGQTWSTPTLTQVPDSSGNPIPVMVVGGGYSPTDHDNNKALSTGDSMGNMVYFINAKTGQRLWSAGGRSDAVRNVSDMKWAVPGSISVVDINFDGVADHMYFGDMGGQVFRVDIKADGNHEVAHIASVAGSTTSPRRFYEAPAVAYVKANGVDELYVAIGSGYRAHPLDEVTQEAIFVIRDDSALTANPVQLATVSNMTNVTAGGLPDINHRGWYYTFENTGEKVMASPVIYDGRLLFTTYSPLADEVQADPCTVTFGRSFLHTVELLTARPAALSSEPGVNPPTSRSEQLGQSTPAPTPTLIIDEDGKVIVLVGAEAIGEADLGDPGLRKRRWMQLTPDEANNIKGL